MTPDNYDAFAQALLKDTLAIGTRKGKEYANSDDRLANFKRVAAAQGSDPLTVAHTYAFKHWDAICHWVKEGGKNTYSTPPSEPIRGRIMDLINYLILLLALHYEREPGDPSEGHIPGVFLPKDPSRLMPADHHEERDHPHIPEGDRPAYLHVPNSERLNPPAYYKDHTDDPS